MTEKQMLKYVGKNVKIVKHTFPHSLPEIFVPEKKNAL